MDTAGWVVSRDMYPGPNLNLWLAQFLRGDPSTVCETWTPPEDWGIHRSLGLRKISSLGLGCAGPEGEYDKGFIRAK